MKLSIFLLSFTLFTQITFSQNMKTWYEFHPTNTPKAGEIGLQHWLEKPAGKHGRILSDGDRLMYNGEPIKLWGLNLTYSACAPDKSLAEKRAAFYAKYGINSVRLHKYADGTGWAGIQSEESFVEFDPDELDEMDYQVAQFKEHGIYVKLSSTFGVKLGPADKQYVPYMDEFGEMRGNRLRTGHGSIFLSKELQNLQIRQIMKMLKHKNPYTGMRYADDPAVAIVEMYNEDSVLFYTTMDKLEEVPTLRKRAAIRFSGWLKEKYGSQEALVKAWGKEALNSFEEEGFTGEHLDKGTIVPAGNPWYYDPERLNGSQSFRKKRLLDTMRFLYELQNEFYQRYEEAIRQTGYEGEIIASNWQAGRMYSHYYNLHSDAQIGMIDRHNYFGGGNREGKINNASMLSVPGSATLSSGMQQVAGRPFMLSEWIHVFPNEWGVEGPAIIGAYAMGLQGWDVSYMFQNRDQGGFSDELGGHRWDVTAPQILGVFPAVSRQVLRRDVKEAEVTAKRFVHIPSLMEGKLGFEDEVTQQHDVKTFNSDKVPAQTLAVARSVVEFTDKFRDTPKFNLSKYHEENRYTSSTDQLKWVAGDTKTDGRILIQTNATQGVVGFAQGKTCDLRDVTITPKSRYAAIYVTAQGQEETIASADKLLIVAIARARNTGMKINQAGDKLLEKGEGPVLMEPVKAEITLNRTENANVYLLDHDGLKTVKMIPVENGVIEINGANDQTPYYLIEF